MVLLKDIVIDGHNAIDINERIYVVKDNPIGAREKFWVVRESGNIFVEPLIVTDMLFKYNRNGVSCEDYGEVLSSKIYNLAGLKTVEYYFATYEKEGKEYKGVICGSYKKMKDEVETSGYTLQNVLTPLNFDKETGIADKSINTVDGFISDLDFVIKDTPYKEAFLETIRNDLLKQCLLDFIVAQTDRHWLNTTFLERFRDGVHVVRKANCYDNGCMSFLKRKKEALFTIVKQINGDYNSPRIHQLMEKYNPMFGVKTSTVIVDVEKAEKYGTPEMLKVIPGKKIKQVFLDELTQEILHNPELATFYIKFRSAVDYDAKSKKINIDGIFDSFKNDGDEIDQTVKGIVTAVMSYQFNQIEQELNRKLNRDREKGNE